MRITAEAWLTAMFKFFGDALLDSEKSETASWLIDELEDTTGIEFSPDEKKELSDAIEKLLSEETCVRDVKSFINSFQSEKSPSVAVFFLPPESLRVRKVEGKSAVESSKFQSEKDERNSNRKN
jgi:hypothetical protein